MIRQDLLAVPAALLMSAPLAHAGEVYMALGLRAELGPSGSFNHDGSEEGVDYNGDLNLRGAA